jgi:hypothetical protein
MSDLRYFTEAGRTRWGAWIDELRAEPSSEFPTGLLTNPDFTFLIPGNLTIDREVFSDKFTLARKLAALVTAIREARSLPSNRWVGFWDWLAAFYFDSICEKKEGGIWKLKEKSHYYLSDSYNRTYRHRIFGPVDLYSRLANSSRLLISGPPSSLTDWEEPIASRIQISKSRNLANALFRLYWDPNKEAPKRGAAPNTRKPGTLRRFLDLIQQLDRTYDLTSISTDCILELLPREFDRYKK